MIKKMLQIILQKGFPVFSFCESRHDFLDDCCNLFFRKDFLAHHIYFLSTDLPPGKKILKEL